jgi:hypothetical protein
MISNTSREIIDPGRQPAAHIATIAGCHAGVKESNIKGLGEVV